MNIFKEWKMLKVFDLNIKNVIFALVLSIVCTMLSFHYFVKTDFWQSNFSLPMHIRLQISHNGSDINNSLQFKTNQADIVHATYQVNKEYKFDKFIKITAPAIYQTYNFQLVSGEKNTVKIVTTNFFNGDIDVKSFKINGKELSSDVNFKNSDYIINTEPESVLDISVTCKPADTVKAALSQQISVPALLVTFLFYFCIFLFVITKILRTGIKQTGVNILKLITKNKTPLILLSAFFLFYLCENLYTIIHLNQFNWVVGHADTPVIPDLIWDNATRRFHPYFFLPFYPLFDTLILITRHIFLSIGLIFALLASLSVMFLYKALDIIMPQRRMLSVILSCIYGFSWAQMHLSQAFDLYIITGFYLCLILYLVVKELSEEKYDCKNLALIVLVSALTLGVTIPNIVTALILVLPVFIIKKNPKVILTCILSFILLVSAFTQFKSLTCNGMAWQHLFHKGTKGDVKTWVRASWGNFRNETLRQPLISQERHKKIYKNTVKCFTIPFFIILLLSLVVLIAKSKNISTLQKRIFYSSFAALIYNFVSNYFWCPTQGLLFSLNHFALWFILLGSSINILQQYLKTQKQKDLFLYIICSCLIIFMAMELILNHNVNHKRHKYLLEISPITYNVLEMRK